MTMIAQDLNESNTRGVEGIAHNTFLVTTKDRTFTFVGTEFEAQEFRAQILNDLTDDDVHKFWHTPIGDIPDDYWKNGDIEPLRLEDEPEMPFDGRPMHSRPITARDEVL